MYSFFVSWGEHFSAFVEGKACVFEQITLCHVDLPLFL